MSKYKVKYVSEKWKSGRKSLKEAVDVKSVISELIDTNWSGSNDEQMKAVQLLKGVATSDDPLSNKFMKALDKATSGMKKDDYK